MSEKKLPLELLKEKYYPVVSYPEKFGISVAKVMSLIQEGKIRKAEFRVPGESKRTLHVNYEEVLSALEEERDE